MKASNIIHCQPISGIWGRLNKVCILMWIKMRSIVLRKWLWNVVNNMAAILTMLCFIYRGGNFTRLSMTRCLYVTANIKIRPDPHPRFSQISILWYCYCNHPIKRYTKPKYVGITCEIRNKIKRCQPIYLFWGFDINCVRVHIPRGFQGNDWITGSK